MSYGTANFIFFYCLLQNASNPIKKRGAFSLQNAAATLVQNVSILLQNAAVIAKCIDYYKTRHKNIVESLSNKVLALQNRVKQLGVCFNCLEEALINNENHCSKTTYGKNTIKIQSYLFFNHKVQYTKPSA